RIEIAKNDGVSKYNGKCNSHKEMLMKVMLPRVMPAAVTTAAFALGFVLASPCTSHSQILVSKQGPVVYGHHHLNTTNMDAQKKFFVDTLGGKLIKVGQNNQ